VFYEKKYRSQQLCFSVLLYLVMGGFLSFGTVALGQSLDKDKKSSVLSTEKKSSEQKSSKNPSYFSLDFNGMVGVSSTEPILLKMLKVKEGKKDPFDGYEEKEDFPLRASVELGYNQGFKGFTLSGSGVFFAHQYKILLRSNLKKYQKVMPTGFGGKLGGRVNVTDNFALGLNGTFNVFVKLFGDKTYSGKYMGAELVSSAKVAQRLYVKFAAGMNFWQSWTFLDLMAAIVKRDENEVFPFVPKYYALLGFHLNVFQVS